MMPLEHTDPVTVDTAEAAELLDVPASVIRSWATRQRVAPVAYRRAVAQGRPSPLWLLEELQPLAERYRSRSRHADADAG